MREDSSENPIQSKTGQAGIPSELNKHPDVPDTAAALSQLFSLIRKLSDEADRERAETNAKALQAALESGNKFKARELVRILEESVGRVQALIAINRSIGIPDGNIR